MVVLAAALFPACHAFCVLGARPAAALRPFSAAAPGAGTATEALRSRGRRASAAAPARSTALTMFGGFNGGFLNLGTPEVIVIGAVAWAVLGPKELFRLAKQAGEFLGQWQQLGQQAKDTFTSALEQELADDEATSATPPPPSPKWAETLQTEMASSTGARDSSALPSTPIERRDGRTPNPCIVVGRPNVSARC